MLSCNFTLTKEEYLQTQRIFAADFYSKKDSSGAEKIINTVFYFALVSPLMIFQRFKTNRWLAKNGLSATHLEISENGFSAKSKLDFERDWDDIQSVTESASFFFFLSRDNVLFILPKRAVETEIEAIEAVIGENFGEWKKIDESNLN